MNFGKYLYSVQPQLLTIFITTFLIVIGAITYYVKLKSCSYTKAPKGYVLVVERFLTSIEGIVVDVLNPRFRWVTPYIVYLLLYAGIGNLLSLIGLDSPISSYTVVFSMGIVSFVSIYIFGIWAQKLLFFKKFLQNPTELLTQFAPLVSITFRFFGNLVAGTTILWLFYQFTGFIWGKIPFLGEVNILGGLLAPPFHFYFDIFDGLIQTYIFALLTLSYVGLELQHDSPKKRKFRKQKETAIDTQGYYYDPNVDFVRE